MGGGGGLSVGFAALNTERRRLSPYVGMLGHGVSALIRNGATEQAVGTRTMGAGEQVLLEGGRWVADLGLGYQMGLWVPLTEGDWVENGDAVGGLGKVPLSFYLRLNVGGGSAKSPPSDRPGRPGQAEPGSDPAEPADGRDHAKLSLRRERHGIEASAKQDRANDKEPARCSEERAGLHAEQRDQVDSEQRQPVNHVVARAGLPPALLVLAQPSLQGMGTKCAEHNGDRHQERGKK